MQADVQRNINQQQRVEQGVKSGQLTNREAGKLENGQARVDREDRIPRVPDRAHGVDEGRTRRKVDRYQLGHAG